VTSSENSSADMSSLQATVKQCNNGWQLSMTPQSQQCQAQPQLTADWYQQQILPDGKTTTGFR